MTFTLLAQFKLSTAGCGCCSVLCIDNASSENRIIEKVGFHELDGKWPLEMNYSC